MRSVLKSWQFTAMMVAIAIIGLLLILIGNYLGNSLGPWTNAVAEIGIAGLIAGILGVSVDLYVRQRVAEDVFKAAMGYILPEELRPEMEWVYRQKIICIQHDQHCKLTLLEAGLVVMEMRFNRTFLNVSLESVEVPLLLSVDEWYIKGYSSEILEFGYRVEGERYKSVDVTKCKHSQCSLDIEPFEVTLAPKRRLEVWGKVKEIKHTSDEQLVTCRHAVRDPLVTVTAPETIDFLVSFGHRQKESECKLGENGYRLNGTLLPGQVINLRWWEKQDI